MNVELAEDFHFSTGARTGTSWPYNFTADSVAADRENRQFIIRASEPDAKGHGVEVQVTFPFSVVPDLMHAMLKSLTEEE